jgi:hypothetical protein
MLQPGANHFQAATKLMERGLAVLILTDLREQFDMDSDNAIGELFCSGYCRYDKPQSYSLLLVNPIINKMLKALKTPVQLKISDQAYKAMDAAQSATRVCNTVELEILQQLRRPDISRITINDANANEVEVEIHESSEFDGTVEKEQGKDQPNLISRKSVKKVVREDLGIIVARLKD